MSPREWAEVFQRVANEDRELRAHGRHYTCSFVLDMAEHNFVLHVVNGEVTRIAVDPHPLAEHSHFVLRASLDTWRKFASPTPEPMYQGIFAAQAQRDMRILGDMLVLMQHLRPLTRHLELMRQIGVPE